MPLERHPTPSTAAGKAPSVHADAILLHLTTQQHLHPHDPVGAVMEQTTQAFGCCPQAIHRGIEWLGVDPASAIGRLRRSEMLQLARAVHRFWTQNLNAASEPTE